MNISYSIGRDDVIKCYLSQIKLYNLFASIYIILITIFNAFLYQLKFSVCFLIILISIGLNYYESNYFRVKLTKKIYRTACESILLEINKDYLQYVDTNNTLTIDWSDIKSVSRLKNYIVFNTNLYANIILPIRCFDTDKDANDFFNTAKLFSKNSI